MSATASAVAPTRGFAQIPNSFIENQAAFTAAERALALIVCRRENNNPGAPVTVSDQLWKDWTGLEPRTKEAAVAGLRKKCLTVVGRGNAARYSFARDQWHTFCRSIDRASYRARTAGRGVDPKRGSKIHAECRARGCAMLSSEPGFESGLKLVTPIAATPNPQRVAQTAGDLPKSSCPGSRPIQPVQETVQQPATPIAATPNPQRVAQTPAVGAAGMEKLWAKTLAALRSVYPMIGVAFLVRLLAAVRAVFGDVQDKELAEAVGLAHSSSAHQLKAGLFLLTVPDAISALRRGPPAALVKPTVPDGDPVFKRYVGAFLAAGVLLNDADLSAAAAEWAKVTGLPEEQHEQAAAWAEAHARDTEARFMGLPATQLQKKPWLRFGPGRILPEPRSKGEKSLDDYFAERRGK